MHLPEDHFLFRAMNGPPCPDTSFQCPSDACIEIRMPAQHLLENGNHPDARRSLEQGNDLFLEYPG